MTKRKLFALIISSMAILVIVQTQFFKSGGRPAAAALPEQDHAGGVSALFQIAEPKTAPFPSDLFTVVDTANVTGRRVSLPKPDCSTFVSDCEDIDVINTLDGFGLQTRISIPFDGDIHPASVNSQTVFLIHLTTGDVIGINQIVWDVASKSLHVEVDELLDQHSRYAVFVTRGLRDVTGAPVNPSKEFVSFRRDLNFGQSGDPVLKDYRKTLLDAIAAVEARGIENKEIIVASVFTTQSITPVMERIRDQIKVATPEPASFLLGPSNERSVFSRADVSSIVWRQHTRQSPVGFNTVNLDISALQVVPDSVGIIAHGKFASPEYRVPDGYIPATGTLTGTPAVRAHNDIHFSLFLPAGQKPVGGWPVVIFSHGGGSSRHVGANFHASKLASNGLATVAISAPGYGFGPQGSLTVNLISGGSLTIPDGGRGFDQNLDGVIGNAEGSSAVPPRSWAIGERDGNRQAVIDMMQLVRVIEAGVDADGDGMADLDHSKIYHHGNSIGAMIGTIFMALEPKVEAAVESVPGGMLPEHGRWAPGRRAGLGREMQLRIPSLINPSGVTQIDGVSIAAPHFNENKPLRDRPPVVNDTPGAMEIQAAFEMLEWGQQSGQSPIVWAPYIREYPLAGMSPKRVIYQYAQGDQNSTGPGSAALIRAGLLTDRVTYYRHDLAFAENPLIPKNPHGVVNSSTNANLLYRSIARGLQDQNGLFFSSDQAIFFLPEPTRFFEFLVAPLPDELNYIP